MSYSLLYEAVQSGECSIDGLSRQICTRKLKKIVQDDTGLTIVHIRLLGLRHDAMQGMFLYQPSFEVRGTVIENVGLVLTPKGAGNGSKLERYIFTKELMHAFEDPRDFTSDESSLRELTLDVFERRENPGIQAQNDMTAHWLALGVLCSEPDRQQIFDNYHADGLDYPINFQTISDELKIPAYAVEGYFRDNYHDLVSRYKNRFD